MRKIWQRLYPQVAYVLLMLAILAIATTQIIITRPRAPGDG